MAKLIVAREGESRRISLAVWAATSAVARDPDGRRPDLLATAVLAALDVALDAMRVPALVADRRGEVVCSNAPGRALIGERTHLVRWSPAAKVTEPGEAGWEVTPLGVAGLPAWSLLIFRAPEVPSSRRWNLTARQAEVLELVARGLTNTGIAETLGIRPGTVEFHISAIFDKAGVNSRAALIASVKGG